jgi:hypothetical protein
VTVFNNVALCTLKFVKRVDMLSVVIENKIKQVKANNKETHGVYYFDCGQCMKICPN